MPAARCEDGLLGALPVLTRDGVEEAFGADGEAEFREAGGEHGGEAVDARGDGFEAFGAVIDGVHAGHDGEEDLRGADVGGGFFAADVLFAGLEGEAVGRGCRGSLWRRRRVRPGRERLNSSWVAR